MSKDITDIKEVKDPSIADTVADSSKEIWIGDRYVLHEKIGEGGMGAVFRATHVLMGKPVALKLIHRELAQIPEVEKRFEREAKSASRLSDPNCITVTDFGRTDDGMLYLVMELLDGESLADRLGRTGFLSIEKTIDITKQILKALIHAHEQGVIHRDLKPDNVMLVSQGDKADVAKVFDFGIAKLATGVESGDNLTQAGLVVGTPAYLSPEQALGEPADQRADLYAVGVMLFEMLTGSTPFCGVCAMDVITAHLTAPIPVIPKDLNPPYELQEILNKAMAKKPAERFESAREFLNAMETLSDPSLPKPPLLVMPAAKSFLKSPFQAAPQVIKRAVGFVSTYLNDLRPKYRKLVIGLSGLTVFTLVALIFLSIPKSKKQEPTAKEAKIEVVNTPGLDEQEIQNLFEKAEAELKSGLAKEAITTLKQALDKSPQQPVGRLLLGHAELLAGNRGEAMDEYERALSYDDDLASDARLEAHLEEGLKWRESRDKAAMLLAKYNGEKGIDILAQKANSALSSGDEREATRKALINAGKEERIDWLISLTADFNESKNCKKRKKIIAQMEQTQNPDFLLLLETQVVTKKKQRVGFIDIFKGTARENREAEKLQKCIADDVERAINTLNRIKVEKETQS